jgi:hypothetical protein
MADDIVFTIPGESAPVVTETPVVTDPATGEPSLAANPETLATLDANGNAVEPAKVEPVKVEPKAPDVEAALAVAARSSREAREATKALKAAQAELEALKSKPADTSLAEKAANFDAILKNPSLLFKHGLLPDQVMKNILDPNAGVEPLDPVKLKAEILKEIQESQKETPEQIKQREDHEKAIYAQQVETAVTAVTKIIGEAKDFPMVDAEDARGIVVKVTEFCNSKNYMPTEAQAKELILQGIKGLHEKRMKRFGARVPVITQGGQTLQSNTDELGFTTGSPKPQIMTESAKPTPTKTPTSTGNPLPSPRPVFEIGFTK